MSRIIRTLRDADLQHSRAEVGRGAAGAFGHSSAMLPEVRSSSEV